MLKSGQKQFCNRIFMTTIPYFIGFRRKIFLKRDWNFNFRKIFEDLFSRLAAEPSLGWAVRVLGGTTAPPNRPKRRPRRTYLKLRTDMKTSLKIPMKQKTFFSRLSKNLRPSIQKWKKMDIQFISYSRLQKDSVYNKLNLDFWSNKLQ